jgi:eukaryotic-like serine/threonine-protein kinase
MASGSLPTGRIAVAGVLLLSIVAFLVQLVSVRPYVWPAGVGLTLDGDTVFASLADPPAVPRIRPPNLGTVVDAPVRMTNVAPRVEAGTGLSVGAAAGVALPTGQTSVVAQLPADAEQTLHIWADFYRRGPHAAITIVDSPEGRAHALTPQSVWQLDSATRELWMRQHLGSLVQMGAFLTGALILVLLGTRGMTAALMTLALIATAIANGGPMFGAELTVPVIGPLLLIFGWIVTPLSFPIIGLAVLHFPSRAAVLQRHGWIYAVMAALALPMLIISVLSAALLLGATAAAVPLAWLARNGWIFDASFALALAANVLIVVEGIGRYRGNLDPNERRRIQLVVFTGVPAVFAYAVKVGIPLLSALAGYPTQLPWALELLLQAIVLLPAFALPYAVAVKHVFSPRTVLRSGLQYAFARRTLSVLVVAPIAALIVSLVSQRDRPLADIILSHPWFYSLSLGLAALGFRYRNQAQRWLDQRFFRDEYDAREILVSLANRVPYENDPAALVSLVMTQIDNALHPESIAVLAGEDEQLEVLSSLHATVEPLPRQSGLATLLRWSDEPLEVFLDDERSPAARLPAVDRAWIDAAHVTLLVPMFNGTGDGRALVGLIALGQRRSEEPYTTEDRRLLSGIAAQMSVALDLSRLRRRLSTPRSAERASGMLGSRADSGGRPSAAARSDAGAPTREPPLVLRLDTSTIGTCPTCRRCFELHLVQTQPGTACCPDDGAVLQPAMGMPAVVDGKYRVDALVGRGGMGAVFRARDLRLDRDVAIKTVNAELVADSVSQARFQREAQIVARLQHPAIVTIFDYGSLPHGAAFLVMEFVAGEDLRHVLTREKVLPLEQGLELVRGIATGVDAAHRAGVLHRDLKPENILLPASGTGPKVLDFGVAKMAETSAGPSGGTITHGATIVGTPAYMAPEQLRGEPLDGRADVYSLAVLTFEALTGRLPFGVGSFIDIGIKQADGVERLPFGNLPADVAAALREALSLNRDDRPASAGAFAERLRVRPS